MRARPLTSFVFLLFGCSVFLACQGESGSSQADLDIKGFWFGTATPDGGAARNVNVTFNGIGDPEDGDFTAEIRFPQTLGRRRGCPARDYEMVGTLDGSEIDGKWNGTQGFEFRDVFIEFIDNDTAVGTYLVTESASLQGPSCPGETGTWQLERFIE